MRTIALLVCLLAPLPVLASELTVQAISGGVLPMSAGVGYGNWLTESLWADGIMPESDRRLDSFSITVTPPLEADAYRLAVGLLNDRGQWAGDVFSTDWTTDPSMTAIIPGGLELAPGLKYLAYIVPGSAGWSMGTTGTNIGPGVVGVSLLFYTDSNIVDMDLPQDRDVAMTATFSAVPEPATGLLVGLGAVMVWIRRQHR